MKRAAKISAVTTAAGVGVLLTPMAYFMVKLELERLARWWGHRG